MGEWENRLRAARGYAGLSQTELAQRMERSKSSVVRIEGGQPEEKLTDYQRRTITTAYADICGIPEAFFAVDFAELGRNHRPPKDALEEVQRQLTRLSKEAVERSRTTTGEIEKVARAAAHDRGRLRKIEESLERLLELLVENETGRKPRRQR